MAELNNNIIAKITIAGRKMGLSYTEAAKLYDSGKLDVSDIHVHDSHIVCDYCGKAFYPPRSNSRFCSVRCRERYWGKSYYDERRKRAKEDLKKYHGGR